MKRVIILFSLSVLIGACNIAINITKKETDQPKTHLEMSRSLMSKKMIETQHIDPLSDIQITAKSAVLINTINGDVLFKKRMDDPLPIASMSKIMSTLLVLEAVEKGKIQWEDNVPISDYAHTISHQPGYASIELQQDTSYTVQELFHAMTIASANGATIALAELISDSEKNFVHLMNQKARYLQLETASFVNSTGLTNHHLLSHHSIGSLEDSNKMAAIDLAKLTTTVLDNYPHILDITEKKSFRIQDETFMSSNWMLPGTDVDFIDIDVTFSGVDGIKTGFTEDAGYGFTGTVQIDGIRFVSVIIGSEKMEERFLETKMLYNAISEQLNHKNPSSITNVPVNTIKR